MVVFPFSYALFVHFSILYSVIVLFGHSMPPRKKNAGAQAGSGENQQVEVSVDHISMHIIGIESFEKVRQLENEDIMASIEDL